MYWEVYVTFTLLLLPPPPQTMGMTLHVNSYIFKLFLPYKILKYLVKYKNDMICADDKKDS